MMRPRTLFRFLFMLGLLGLLLPFLPVRAQDERPQRRDEPPLAQPRDRRGKLEDDCQLPAQIGRAQAELRDLASHMQQLRRQMEETQHRLREAQERLAQLKTRQDQARTRRLPFRGGPPLPPPGGPRGPDRRLDEIDRKLDRLLNEMADLRRELRSRGRGDRPGGPRRDNHPTGPQGPARDRQFGPGSQDRRQDYPSGARYPGRTQRTAPRDQDRLQGTWLLSSAEEEGKPITPSEIGIGKHVMETAKFFIRGNNISVVANDEEVEFPFHLYPAREPKAFDISGEYGELRDFKLRGIYALEGETLKICFNDEKNSQSRPASFTTRPDSKRVLCIFKRGSRGERSGRSP